MFRGLDREKENLLRDPLLEPSRDLQCKAEWRHLMVVGPRWESLISKHEILIKGRAQIVVFELGDETLAIVNIYAPHTPADRAAFWEALYMKIPQELDGLILLGDFNQIEDLADRIGGSQTITTTDREQRAWDDILFTWGIADCFLSENFTQHLPYFTWKSKVDGMQERLDRYYASRWFSQKGGALGIHPEYEDFSDHRPLTYYSKLFPREGGKRMPTIRKSIPENLQLLNKEKKFWNEQQTKNLPEALSRIANEARKLQYIQLQNGTISLL